MFYHFESFWFILFQHCLTSRNASVSTLIRPVLLLFHQCERSCLMLIQPVSTLFHPPVGTRLYSPSESSLSGSALTAINVGRRRWNCWWLICLLWHDRASTDDHRSYLSFDRSKYIRREVDNDRITVEWLSRTAGLGDSHSMIILPLTVHQSLHPLRL